MTDSLRFTSSWCDVPVGRVSGELDSALHLRVRTEGGIASTSKEVGDGRTSGDERPTIQQYLGQQDAQYSMTVAAPSVLTVVVSQNRNWRMMYFAIYHNGIYYK